MWRSRQISELTDAFESWNCHILNPAFLIYKADMKTVPDGMSMKSKGGNASQRLSTMLGAV